MESSVWRCQRDPKGNIAGRAFYAPWGSMAYMSPGLFPDVDAARLGMGKLHGHREVCLVASVNCWGLCVLDKSCSGMRVVLWNWILFRVLFMSSQWCHVLSRFPKLVALTFAWTGNLRQRQKKQPCHRCAECTQLLQPSDLRLTK